MHLSVLTHWETLTYFMKLPPLPKSRALLGARNVLFDCAVRSHLALPLSVMLGYLAEELQAPIPTIFLSRLQAAATQADTLEREAALSGARSGARGGFKNLLRRTSDWRMRAFVLRWMLFPSPEYLRSVQQIQPSRFLPFFYVDRCLKFLISRRS